MTTNDDDNSLKLCELCNNVMMIVKTESDTAKWKCTLCSNQVDITTATTISCLRKSTQNDNNNPRYMHEITSALNQIVYRRCKVKGCKSLALKRKACLRKIIYDDGVVRYSCLDCPR